MSLLINKLSYRGGEGGNRSRFWFTDDQIKRLAKPEYVGSPDPDESSTGREEKGPLSCGTANGHAIHVRILFICDQNEARVKLIMVLK